MPQIRRLGSLNMDPRIDFVTDFIRHHYRQRLTLAEMASTVNLSRWRFSHLFKEYMGISPERFLTQVRLETARQLLETEFLTVKEVMNQVGMSDASFFARSFRAAYGITPGRYRNTHRVKAIKARKRPFEEQRAEHVQ